MTSIMNKEKLVDVFSKHAHAYPKLYEEIKANSASEKWGMGPLPPLTLEPYDIELLGCKRGKMLKKDAHPGKNRFRYLFDEEGRMVCMQWYSTLLPDGEWMHDDDLFIHDEGGIFQFRFGGIADDPAEARLHKVTYLSLESGNVKTSYTYWYDKKYDEVDYLYNNGQINSIQMRLWQESYFERFFEVKHDGDLISIIELSNGKTYQIFPKK